MKLIPIVVFIFFSSVISAKEVMSADAPSCIGRQVKTPEDAKCITLFHAQFMSVIGVLGGEWNVKAIRRGEYWYIYPTKENNLLNLDTLLFKINAKTGELSEYRPKT